MAFDASKLELLAGGGVVLSLWGYATSEDAMNTIDTEGYFNKTSGVLKVGDWIFVNAADGHGIAVVSSNAGGVVDLADVQLVGGADAR